MLTSCGSLRKAQSIDVAEVHQPTRAFEQNTDTTLAKLATEIDFSQAPDTTFTFLVQAQFMEAPGDWDDVYIKQGIADFDSSIVHANDYFDGAIQFVRDPFVWRFDAEGKTIYDVYDSFTESPADYDDWVATRAVDSAITVFVMPTQPRGAQILLGFCPVLSFEFEIYEKETPAFDNLFVTYQGLTSGKTLAHELGHWLGLAHTFPPINDELRAVGVTSNDIAAINLMNYVPMPEELTALQIKMAWAMAATYRAYRLY